MDGVQDEPDTRDTQPSQDLADSIALDAETDLDDADWSDL